MANEDQGAPSQAVDRQGFQYVSCTSFETHLMTVPNAALCRIADGPDSKIRSVFSKPLRPVFRPVAIVAPRGDPVAVESMNEHHVARTLRRPAIGDWQQPIETRVGPLGQAFYFCLKGFRFSLISRSHHLTHDLLTKRILTHGKIHDEFLALVFVPGAN